MATHDLNYMTISQLEPLIREKQLSPVELVQACLSQIRDLDGKFHAFITLLEESALSAANHAERSIISRGYLGPLHGIPIGFKDIYNVKGVRTTAGSRILADYVPQEDAISVANLRAAGGIPLGKLNLHQFAFGPTGVNPHSGTSRNPWNTERIPGGSSSGSGWP